MLCNEHSLIINKDRILAILPTMIKNTIAYAELSQTQSLANLLRWQPNMTSNRYWYGWYSTFFLVPS